MKGGGGEGGRWGREGSREREREGGAVVSVIVVTVLEEVVQVEGTTSPSRPRRMIRCSIAR